LFKNHFSESRAVYEIMWTNTVQPEILGSSTPCSPKGLSRPVVGQLYVDRP